MVELNNKLKLPIYTRFEHYLNETFIPKTEININTNLKNITTHKPLETTLDTSVKQIKQHFSRVTKSLKLIVDENYNEVIKIKLDSQKSFSGHEILLINENTQNTIIVEFDFNNELSSNAFEVKALENSYTQLILISKGNAINSNFIKANVEKNATLNIYYINSAKSDLNDISVALLGENATSHLKTVAIAQEAKKFFSVRIDHFAKRSYGRIVNHGIALEHGHLIMNGFGKIHKQCNDSDNYQKSKLLALGQTSKVEANPILLIDEFDVVASHAASVSNVDLAQLYYLKSRGINENLAKILLIKGFLKAIVNEIDNDKVKEEFETTINTIIGYKNEF